MRGGVLLAEEPPNQLMQRYECNDLEEVFLRLSHEQEIEPKDCVSIRIVFPKKSPDEMIRPLNIFQ